MAFDQYILVGESDIYDKQGFRKAIFLQMAGLIQTKEELEDGTPNPNLGWVVQSEKWIAERLGISESAVYKAIKKFVQDGLWIREERRDSHGHLHCRWRLAEGAQERLREAKRGKGPRVTNPKKANNRSFKPRGSEPTGSLNPHVSVPSSARPSLTAASPEASRLGACLPDGSDTQALRLGAGNDVELDVPLLSNDRTIAIANVSSSSERDKELKTAGETPATPTSGPNSDFTSESEFDEADGGIGEPVSSSPGQPISSSPASTQDFAALPSWETEPARHLANYLLCFLRVREDVEVPPGWEKFWTKDFQEVLNSGWSLADLKIAIRASQVGKAREYYKRGASIVRNLELLVNNGQKLQERGLLPTNPDGTSYRLPIGWDEDWGESLRLPSTPAQQACEKRKGHVWIDVLHTTQQCSACGKVRTNPVVTQWTAADDLEAACMEFLDNYDPYDPESPPTSAIRALLPSEAMYRWI